MNGTRPDATTLGRLWMDSDGVIWEQISYTDQPTASFNRAVAPSQRLSGVVNSLLLSSLRLLTMEEEGDFWRSVRANPLHKPEGAESEARPYE